MSRNAEVEGHHALISYSKYWIYIKSLKPSLWLISSNFEVTTWFLVCFFFIMEIIKVLWSWMCLERKTNPHLRWLLFVCLGLTSLLNIWSHITTVPACSSGTLTNVLPYRNSMPQTQDTTPHPVTVYRHGADLSLCYQLYMNHTAAQWSEWSLYGW